MLRFIYARPVFLAVILGILLLLNPLLQPQQIALATDSPRPSLANALALEQLNLVHWKSDNPASFGENLSTVPTNIEGLIIAIRLMGQEKEALSPANNVPVEQVPPWAWPYVNYANQIGLIHSDFRCDQPLAKDDYLAMLNFALDKRGLKYHDFSAVIPLSEPAMTRAFLADLTYPLLADETSGLSKELLKENVILLEDAILADLPVDGNTVEAYESYFHQQLSEVAEPFSPTEKNKALLRKWMAEPTSPFVYVSKENTLAKDFVPPLEMVRTLPSKTQADAMQPLAYAQLSALFAKAEQDGITLYARSGYRSYQTQVGLYGNGSNPYRAQAGASEHQSGLAMDLVNQKNALSSALSNSTEALWLKENAPSFGFIIRYPQGKEAITGYPAEWWHLRYVGKTLAFECQSKDITYDEFYQSIQEISTP